MFRAVLFESCLGLCGRKARLTSAQMAIEIRRLFLSRYFDILVERHGFVWRQSAA